MKAAGEQQVLVIDEGTTGTRAVLVDRAGRVVASAYREIAHHCSAPGFVEQDPEEIWRATRDVCAEVVEHARSAGARLAAVAVANQRSTTLLWDLGTGEPVGRAIVWQDVRTAGMVDALRPRWGADVHRQTGVVLSTTNSSLMLAWRFEHDPALRARAARGRLGFGTVDSWLVWKLTDGASHAISASNASATGAYRLADLTLYGDWLKALGVPRGIFPAVRDEGDHYGLADPRLFGEDVPVTGVVADQSGALFGQRCFEAGGLKCTHGTGTFLDLNIGEQPTVADGLNTLVGWRRRDRTTFMVESYVPATGTAIQWLRDGAGLARDPAEAEGLAASVPDAGGVVFVPAFAGLAAPYWDPYARGSFLGIDMGTRKAHLVRAVLEGVILAVDEALRALQAASGTPIRSIRADGGLAESDFFLQLQADLQGVAIDRSSQPRFTTCLGAAFIAGLSTGMWRGPDEIRALPLADRTFRRSDDHRPGPELKRTWREAVQRGAGWLPANGSRTAHRLNQDEDLR